MILAAHQPCYLPSIFYFQKLAAADVFVIADDYKYTTNAQINRTKIKTKNSWNWLTLPVFTKGMTGQLIKETKLNNNFNWPEKHIKTLHVNYTYAAYFEQYIDQIEDVLKENWKLMVDLNLELISFIVSELSLSTEVLICSDLNLKQNSNQKLFEMLTKTSCDTYLADSRLSTFLKPNNFEEVGFVLKFAEPYIKKYYQLFDTFVSNLSIIDLLFNEGNESKNYLVLE